MLFPQLQTQAWAKPGRLGVAILQVLLAGTLMALGPQPYRGGGEGGRRMLVLVYFSDHSCLEQMMQPVTQPIKSTKHKQLLSLATS